MHFFLFSTNSKVKLAFVLLFGLIPYRILGMFGVPFFWKVIIGVGFLILFYSNSAMQNYDPEVFVMAIKYVLNTLTKEALSNISPCKHNDFLELIEWVICFKIGSQQLNYSDACGTHYIFSLSKDLDEDSYFDNLRTIFASTEENFSLTISVVFR